jgi:hypothetical protein
VDRDAIARSRRREQALEALRFERDRELALVDQIGAIVLEEEGRRVDEEVFGRMSPADVAIVREVLDDGWAPEDDDVGGEDELETESWLVDDEDAPEADGGEVDEITRLEGELEGCRERQRALERYVEALSVGAARA